MFRSKAPKPVPSEKLARWAKPDVWLLAETSLMMASAKLAESSTPSASTALTLQQVSDNLEQARLAVNELIARNDTGV